MCYNTPKFLHKRHAFRIHLTAHLGAQGAIAGKTGHRCRPVRRKREEGGRERVVTNTRRSICKHGGSLSARSAARASRQRARHVAKLSPHSRQPRPGSRHATLYIHRRSPIVRYTFRPSPTTQRGQLITLSDHLKLTPAVFEFSPPPTFLFDPRCPL